MSKINYRFQQLIELRSKCEINLTFKLFDKPHPQNITKTKPSATKHKNQVDSKVLPIDDNEVIGFDDGVVVNVYEDDDILTTRNVAAKFVSSLFPKYTSTPPTLTSDDNIPVPSNIIHFRYAEDTHVQPDEFTNHEFREKLEAAVNDKNVTKTDLHELLTPRNTKLTNSRSFIEGLETVFGKPKKISLSTDKIKPILFGHKIDVGDCAGYLLIIDPASNTMNLPCSLNLQTSIDVVARLAYEDDLSASEIVDYENKVKLLEYVLWCDGKLHGLEVTSKINSNPRYEVDASARISLPGWNGRPLIWIPGARWRANLSISENVLIGGGSSLLSDSYDGVSVERKMYGEVPEILHLSGEVIIHAFQTKGRSEAFTSLYDYTLRYKRFEITNTILSGNIPALSLACLHGNYLAVQCLVSNGADVNRYNSSSQSFPIHDAITGGNSEVVSFLLDRGAFVCCRDETLSSPLHVACKIGHVSSIRMLLNCSEVRKLLRMKDKHGRTANHVCSYKSHKALVEGKMKQFKLKINSDKNWWTSLNTTYMERPNGLKKASAEDVKNVIISAHNKSRSPSSPERSKTAPG